MKYRCDVKIIADMIDKYSAIDNECKYPHRKVAKIIGIKDWEAYQCVLAIKDLKNEDKMRDIHEYLCDNSSVKSINYFVDCFGISRFAAAVILNNYGSLIGYTYDETFFLNDTSESFYWAGFIAADGNVSSKTNTMTIGLAGKDALHLEKFKKSIGTNSKIVIKDVKMGYKYFTKASIRITSSKIKGSLVRFNIVPQKTNIYVMPNFILTHKYLHHFLRGYFDGDGSFFITSRGDITFSMCGVLEFLGQWQSILSNIGIKPNSIQKKCETKHLCEIQHRGRIIVGKIFDLLYMDSNVNTRMDRKYDLYMNYYKINGKERKDKKEELLGEA